MKKIIIIILALESCCFCALAQKNYPDPEFTNEVYYLRKDSVYTLVRLEKGSSKMDTKTKMGGYGGYEAGYFLEGERSCVKIPGGSDVSFIISNGSTRPSSSSDSVMRANGIDPSTFSGRGGMGDLASSANLYKAESGKGERKFLTQKMGGVFGGKKASASTKFTFSVKKIREGYWELVVDKPLPKGEYAFTIMGMDPGSMDGSVILYAFSVQ
jgi:hypothetical protein